MNTFFRFPSLSLIFLITLYWTLKLKQYKKSFSSLLLVRCCGLPSSHWLSKARAINATVLMPPKYLETFDKRKNFVKFLLCFYFWNLFSFYCWGSVQTEVWRYLRESQSHPCCQIYKEMMKYHSFPAIGHGLITTLFSNTFHNSFFLRKCGAI